jgi:hypothetical protein
MRILVNRIFAKWIEFPMDPQKRKQFGKVLGLVVLAELILFNRGKAIPL